MTTYALYRFFDADGALLYVGQTIDARRRWRDHEKTKAWFNDVATVTRAVLPTLDELIAAEEDAIRAERPRYNIAHAVKGAPLEVTDQLPIRLLYPPSEIAAHFVRAGIPGDIEELVRDGDVETVTIGRRRLIPAEALTDYVERLKAAS